MQPTYKVVTHKLGGTNVDAFIGSKGTLFFDLQEKRLRVSNGATPGGVYCFNSPLGRINSNSTFCLFTENLGATRYDKFVGDDGDVFYHPRIPALFVSDGFKKGGVQLTGITSRAPVGRDTVVVLVTQKLGGIQAIDFVGDLGEVFYDPKRGGLRMCNGLAGGAVVSSL